MGLAIIHGIVTDYGGAVSVESELAKGTTFHVYFPVLDQQGILFDQDEREISSGNARVLFIDDEEVLANLGKEMLEQQGYKVTVQLSSIDALSAFEINPDAFDVVITDQTMPGMTGAELARRLLQIRPDIPIILCTGFSSQINEETAKSIGIKEFVMKPLSRQTMTSLLHKVLADSGS